jgi:hypothetical protein
MQGINGKFPIVSVIAQVQKDLGQVPAHLSPEAFRISSSGDR